MAAFITPASAQFALEHQKTWSREHHPEDPHSCHHHRHLGDSHSYLLHHHRRSHSDHGLHRIEHSHHHHLGDSLSHLFRGLGHLHQRSHSDYLLHGEKHGHHHASRSQDDHNYSPSVKRHFDVKNSTSGGDEGQGHSHGNKVTNQDHHKHHHDHHHETAILERRKHSSLEHKSHDPKRHLDYKVEHKVWYFGCPVCWKEGSGNDINHKYVSANYTPGIQSMLMGI